MTYLVFKTTYVDRGKPLLEGAFFFTRRRLFPPLDKGNTRDKAPLAQKALISCLFRTLVGVFTSLHRTKIMAKILVAFDTVDEGFEKIGAEHEVIRPPHGRDFTLEELCQLLPEADVLCTSFDYPARAELLQYGSKLCLIANFGVGFNNIDIDYARAHGIVVTNTPQAVIIPTTELTLALMLDCARRVSELDRLIRQTPGKRPTIGRMGYLGVHLAGKTLGLIGYGRIASAVAERARAFGMKILYYKRTPLSADEEDRQGITYAPLDELLFDSDFVSIHTPYSTETHHFIGERELALMKPTAIFINTARGAVVDEEALVKALQTGYIAAAGLDVFENQDNPHPTLCTLDNVCMTPHTGTQTADARRDMNAEMLENVVRFLAGRTDLDRVA